MGTRSKMVAARKARGLTQEALALRAKVSQSTVSKVESGETVPMGDTLAALCEQLELTPQELLARDEDEPAPLVATGTDG